MEREELRNVDNYLLIPLPPEELACQLTYLAATLLGHDIKSCSAGLASISLLENI